MRSGPERAWPTFAHGCPLAFLLLEGRVFLSWIPFDWSLSHSALSLIDPLSSELPPTNTWYRRAKIKATSEEPFQSYAKCLHGTGNDLKKCAKLHDALLTAFHKQQ